MRSTQNAKVFKKCDVGLQKMRISTENAMTFFEVFPKTRFLRRIFGMCVPTHYLMAWLTFTGTCY